MRIQIKVKAVSLRANVVSEAISNIRLLRRAAALLAMTVFFLIFAYLTIPVFAGEEEKEQKAEHKNLRAVSSSKYVQGEIGFMNDRYISIIYNRDLESGTEEEMLLPINKYIKLEHKKSLAQLNIGDTVRIQYQEDAKEDEQGKQEQQSRKAVVISFVKAAANKPALAAGNSVLSEDKLEIKGTKGE